MTQDAERPTAVTGRHLIAGESVESVSRVTLKSRNPAARGDLVGAFQASSAADVAMAVRAAEVAFPGTIGAETHLPFSGWKETGNGHREARHAALDTFTEWKAVYVDFSGRLQRAQIDNQPG